MLTEASGDPGELGRRSPLSSYSSGRESMVRHWVSFTPRLSVARAPAAHTDPAAGPPTARPLQVIYSGAGQWLLPKQPEPRLCPQRRG